MLKRLTNGLKNFFSNVRRFFFLFFRKINGDDEGKWWKGRRREEIGRQGKKIQVRKLFN